MFCRPAFRNGALLWPLLLVVSLCLVAACSDRGSGTAAGGKDAPVAIEVTDSSVIILNQTGTSLVKAQVDLVTGSPSPFMAVLERVQNGEKRTVRLDSFRSRDGTPFRRGVARVHTVKITATDLLGKTHEYQVPFK